MRDRLVGEVCPERLLASVPGVGPTLARRIHYQLDVSTLEDLELAANDGRLARVNGFGARRVAAVRELLDAKLRRARPRIKPAVHRERADPPPSVARLLALDARYRARAERGELPLLEPRGCAPEQDTWLPVLHAVAGAVQYTALYSNTELAHRLGKSRDWVVLHVGGDGREREQPFTVVTETSGELRGKRVVRGREAECREHYAELRRRSRAASTLTQSNQAPMLTRSQTPIHGVGKFASTPGASIEVITPAATSTAMVAIE